MKEENIFRFRNRFLNKKTNQYHLISWSASKYQDNFTYAVGRDITDFSKIV